MTRTANSRVAGFAFLLYIAAGVTAMLITAGAGPGAAAKLAHIAAHDLNEHVASVLTLIGASCALVLAVTLYGLTHEVDHELAVLAMACRITEGVLGGASLMPEAGMLWLATAGGAGAPDAAAAHTLAGFVQAMGGASFVVSATFFAVGSTLFSWLLLRGRMIPIPLAWLGVVASVLLVVGLPLQLAGSLRGPVTQLMWLPMAAFEVPLALWLLIKGVAAPPAALRGALGSHAH